MSKYANELEIACRNRRIKEVEWLLNNGADPNSIGILCMSSGLGYTEIVDLLLEYGADPNSEDALYVACERFRVEVVRTLLRYGANPNTRGVLVCAVSFCSLEITDLLLEHGANPNSTSDILFMASDNEDIEITKLLLEKGADPFIIENEDTKISVLKFLIKKHLIPVESIEKNKDRIPPEVWNKVYE